MTGEFAIAVHALVYLNHKKRTLSSEELAENVCTHPARIRKVMAKLKKSGLIHTKEGIDGGYLYAPDLSSITLKRVSEAIGAEFVKASWKSGDADMDCLIASGMAKMMDDLYHELDLLCKEYLTEKTIGQIDQMIFNKGRSGNEKV